MKKRSSDITSRELFLELVSSYFTDIECCLEDNTGKCNWYQAVFLDSGKECKIGYKGGKPIYDYHLMSRWHALTIVAKYDSRLPKNKYIIMLDADKYGFDSTGVDSDYTFPSLCRLNEAICSLFWSTKDLI